MKYINKFFIIFFGMITVIAFAVNYCIKQQKQFPSEMCWKGKYLIQIEDEGSVYTRIKQFYCETENGIIILEEKNEY